MSAKQQHLYTAILHYTDSCLWWSRLVGEITHGFSFLLFISLSCSHSLSVSVSLNSFNSMRHGHSGVQCCQGTVWQRYPKTKSQYSQLFTQLVRVRVSYRIDYVKLSTCVQRHDKYLVQGVQGRLWGAFGTHCCSKCDGYRYTLL